MTPSQKSICSNVVYLIGIIGIMFVLFSGSSFGEDPAMEQSAPADVSIASPPAATPSMGPRIVFATPTYDFGKVMEGDKVSYDYLFTNTGDEVLEIRNVKPTCGCTTKGEWDRKVEPGQTGKIPITLKTNSVNGSVKKAIRVTTNVPGKALHTLYIKGSVWRPIEITPRYASFGQVVDGAESATKTLRIVSIMEEPLEIQSVKCSSSNFATELETVTPGKEYKLRVSTVPPLKNRTNRGTITLTTSNPQKPKIDILANCYVVPPVKVMPMKILVPPSPITTPSERAVFVNYNVEGSLQISDVQVNSENVSTRVQEQTPGKNYRIIVRFEKDFEYPKDEPLMLSFKTSHPSCSSFRIPIQEQNATQQGRRR